MPARSSARASTRPPMPAPTIAMRGFSSMASGRSGEKTLRDERGHAETAKADEHAPGRHDQPIGQEHENRRDREERAHGGRRLDEGEHDAEKPVNRENRDERPGHDAPVPPRPLDENVVRHYYWSYDK